MIPTYAFVSGGVVLALLLLGWLYARNYIKVPPNRVAVFTGGRRQHIVRGGAKFKIPVIQRVDFMELEPFNVEVRVTDVYSMNGVPVNVAAVGLVRLGSSDEMINTGVERFLTSDRQELHHQVSEILAGNMRSIVSQMTVEDLNSNRPEFTRRVLEEAESAFGNIGMQLDVLTIQNISDNNGYLDALGQKRIAEVRRDAAVGTANAERETREQQAEASRLAEIAEANAAIEIADAHQRRDIEQAKFGANVDREKATAAQAGPLAEATARREVVVAEAAVEQDQERAGIAVEQQRAARAEQAARADVIIPAEARREAEVIQADASRQAAIAAAQADAEATKLAGAADKAARMDAAEALQRELEAEAAGQEQIATALKAFGPEALQAWIAEKLVQRMPELAEHFASQYGNIGNLTVVQNGGSDGESSEDMIAQLVRAVPVGIFSMMKSMEGLVGVNPSNIASGNGSTSLNGAGTSQDGSTTSVVG